MPGLGGLTGGRSVSLPVVGNRDLARTVGAWRFAPPTLYEPPPVGRICSTVETTS